MEFFPHFDGIHCSPENRIVVLDTPPVSGSGGRGQVTAILLQDAQGFDESIQRLQDLVRRKMSIDVNQFASIIPSKWIICDDLVNNNVTMNHS